MALRDALAALRQPKKQEDKSTTPPGDKKTDPPAPDPLAMFASGVKKAQETTGKGKPPAIDPKLIQQLANRYSFGDLPEEVMVSLKDSPELLGALPGLLDMAVRTAYTGVMSDVSSIMPGLVDSHVKGSAPDMRLENLIADDPVFGQEGVSGLALTVIKGIKADNPQMSDRAAVNMAKNVFSRLGGATDTGSETSESSKAGGAKGAKGPKVIPVNDKLVKTVETGDEEGGVDWAGWISEGLDEGHMAELNAQLDNS